MKVTSKAVNRVIKAVWSAGAKKATLILDASTKVTATSRQSSKRRDGIVLTIGALNYAERQHVKRCRAKGIPFTKLITK